ncbi:hypothetical protein QUF76_14650 [Desulfobacterales bacterium HSG16]|nr:hypothetical protein [Desulfobacterales bacterium HSG16]
MKHPAVDFLFSGREPVCDIRNAAKQDCSHYPYHLCTLVSGGACAIPPLRRVRFGIRDSYLLDLSTDYLVLTGYFVFGVSWHVR